MALHRWGAVIVLHLHVRSGAVRHRALWENREKANLVRVNEVKLMSHILAGIDIQGGGRGCDCSDFLSGRR